MASPSAGGRRPAVPWRANMIVDCHTHIWQTPEQLGGKSTSATRTGRLRPRATRFSPVAADARGGRCRRPIPDHHWAESDAPSTRRSCWGSRAVICGRRSLTGYVSEYVNRNPQKLIGFAGIDPTEPSAVDDLRLAKHELKLRGDDDLAGQPGLSTRPTAGRWRCTPRRKSSGCRCSIHPVGQFTEQSKLEYARPYLLGRDRPRSSRGCRSIDRPARPAVGGRDDRAARQAPRTCSPT